MKDYRQGGDGFLLFLSENLKVFDRKRRGWVNFSPWPKQVEICKEALEMDSTGTFKYKFIVFCWPRGEAKSFLACMIAIWRLCCFPREKIILGANSRDQVNFVHFDVIKEHILNSPELVEFIGEDNVLQRGVVLRRDKHGKQKDIFAKDVISIIAPISTAQGIMSNITACTFSEAHKMKDETFFTELAGSTRFIHNSMVLIDSVVAPQGHFMERMYKNCKRGEDDLTYFSHYSDVHYNPDMTDKELESFKRKLLPSEFNRHFRNRWEDAGFGLFSKYQILGMEQFGDPFDVMNMMRDKINNEEAVVNA